MAIIISEVAITSAGEIAIELHNNGPDAVDLTGWSLNLITGTSTTAPGLGTATIPAGGFYTVGHSAISGLDLSPSDAFFGAASVFLIGLIDPTVHWVDKIGKVNGPVFGTDISYQSLLDRTPEPSFLVDNSGDFSVTSPFSTNTLGAACFLAGTQIATPQGPRPVETLAPGDHLLTADGRSVPLLWLGQQSLRPRIGALPEGLEPVRIVAGALGAALPENDLMVTADHALVLDGMLVNAGALVGQPGITHIPLSDLPSPFTVYHVETEAHEVLLANGAPTESFIDYASRHRFDNYADYLTRFGADRLIPEMNLPRISSRRMLTAALRAEANPPTRRAAA
ncbi:Hint domain-containing protein [Mameliella sp.]|uniref:Hint domain-containing protein n=1 Tax=Mameliella sp. TaxID=1924940 RepID=UPI003BA9878A